MRQGQEQPPPQTGDKRDARVRLDPARAVAERGPRPGPPTAVIETRRYRWAIGLIGLALVIAFSAYMYARNGIVTPGIPAGGRLHRFVAPLAGSGINRPANADPRCNPTRPNPRALNVCARRALVLDFFVADAEQCVREVSTLQALAGRFAGVQFAAVAVRATPAQTTALVRAHHWRIPVAYDEDGRIGAIYGVEICPMIELARPGGRVSARLIGDSWLSPRRLALQVRRLLSGPAR